MTLEDVFEIFNNSIVHSFDDDLGLFTHMLESFVNFVDVSHEYFHLLCKSRAGGDAAGGHRRHRQPNETLVRASRSFTPPALTKNHIAPKHSINGRVITP